MNAITLNEKQRKVAATALLYQIKSLETAPSSGLRDGRIKEAKELLEVLAEVHAHDCTDEVYAGDSVTLRGLGIND